VRWIQVRYPWRRRPTLFGAFGLVVWILLLIADAAELVGLGHPSLRPSVFFPAMIVGIAAVWVSMQFTAWRRPVGMLLLVACAVVLCAMYVLPPSGDFSGFLAGSYGALLWSCRYTFTRPVRSGFDRDMRSMQEAVRNEDESALVRAIDHLGGYDWWIDVEQAARFLFQRDPGSYAWRPLSIAIQQRRGPLREAWEVTSEAAELRRDDSGPWIGFARLCNAYRVERSSAERCANDAWDLVSATTLPEDLATLGSAFARLGDQERAVGLLTDSIEAGVENTVTAHITLSLIAGDDDLRREHRRAARKAAGLSSLGRLAAHRREVEGWLASPYLER
jgi:hypothetical protein